MGLNAENLALLERSTARALSLLEADPGLRSAMPSAATLQHVVACRTSIEIVQRAIETYEDRPALGHRRHEIVRDPATGKRTARVLPEFQTISYRELWERIVRLASGLAHAGRVRTGEIATLVGFSTIDHVVAELACHYLGVVSAPCAKNVGAGELELIANECESTTLFCNVEQLLLAATSMQRCPSVKTLVVLDFLDQDDAQREIVERARTILAASRPDLTITTIADVEAVASKVVPPEIPAEDTDPLLSLVYTSGSTGTPKGVTFRERGWHARWSTIPFHELASLPMVSVVFLPQNHMGGRNAVANSLKLGGVAYFTHQSDMSTLFEDIRIVRPTYVHLVPRLSEMIHQHFQSELARRGRGLDAAELARVGDELVAEMRHTFLGDRMLLALTASAPTPPDVLAFIKRCFEIPVVNVFAGTEYGQLFVDGTLIHHNILGVKLVSVPELGYLTSDQPYPRGELHVKTTRGRSTYFKNAKATEELYDADGFLRTGDIFEQRGRDEMVWIDRRNNILKLAQGEFVNIWKLEAAFASGSRFIRQIYIQGNSLRAYLIAVVVPEMAEIEAEARITGNTVTDATTKAIVRAELNRLANANGLQPYETPRDFIVDTEPFSRDNGLLTSLNKPARPSLKRKYGAAIDAVYDELERRASELSDDQTLPVPDRLRRMIATVLGLDEASLDLGQPFRNFGGDSLAATNLCALVHREYGVRLSVSFVLGPDTALADVCTDVEARLKRPDSSAFDRIHGASADAIRERDLRLERFFTTGVATPVEPSETRTVLLTGATGFLGRFLCLELLERAAATNGTVYCLVRAKSDAEALVRLADVYGAGSAMHDRFSALARNHLHVVAGDLERQGFGLPSERYERLAGEVDTIVHAAALVNHALPYAQLFDANVLGTAELFRFALHGRPKRTSYISTNAITLALLGDRDLARETDDTRTLGDGWSASADRHANGYQLSKWAGEVLAQDLCETFGIPVNVFRCNLILPPAWSRGQINVDDFFTRLSCSAVYTGIYPGSFYESGRSTPHLDGFPVDFIAASIASIATSPSRGYALYHVNNVHWNDGVSLDSVMRRLGALGYSLSRVDDHAAWFERFERSLRALPPARQSVSSLPIIDQWRTPLATEKRQRVDASRFRAKVQELRPHGVDDLPHLDDDYIDRCITDLRELGLI